MAKIGGSKPTPKAKLGTHPIDLRVLEIRPDGSDYKSFSPVFVPVTDLRVRTYIRPGQLIQGGADYTVIELDGFGDVLVQLLDMTLEAESQVNSK